MTSRDEMVAAVTGLAETLARHSQEAQEALDQVKALALGLPNTGVTPALRGPTWPRLVPLMTAEHLHMGLGVDTIRHQPQGLEVMRAADTDALEVLTPGGGYRRAKAQAWFECEPSRTLTVEFTIEFPSFRGNAYDFGWQQKVGLGLMALHSGQGWPGGNRLHSPDHFIRITLNDWQRRRANQGLPPRWCIYAYTPHELPGDGWGGPVTTGDGWRKLYVIDAPGPVAGRSYEVKYTLTPAPSGESIFDLSINGDQAWIGTMGPLAATNRIVFNSQYGGSKDDEGPRVDAVTRYSGMLATTEPIPARGA